MTIELKINAESTIIELNGRLDTNAAPSLDKVINEDINDTQHLILDLAGVTYVSSAGLRVLLGAQKKIQKIGTMTVRNVCDSVMEILEMTGFVDILCIEKANIIH